MTAGHGERRSRREEAAIAALLTEPTIIAAAEKCGVSESSLRRWLQDPEFSAQFRTARRAAVDQAVSRLQQATSDAVDTLTRNFTCGVPAGEIAAAKSVIDFALKGVELGELAERIAALEAQAEMAKGATQR